MSESPAQDTTPKTKKKILILNNHQNYDVFREFLAHTLRKLGCAVTECGDWGELLKCCDKDDHDLALVDPRADGYSRDTLGYLAARSASFKRLQTVGIRLHEEDDQKDFEKIIGARAYILKTFLPHQLYFTFMRLLANGVANQRETPRALASFPVEYRGLGSHEWEYDRCFNISTGGIFLQSYRNRGHAGFLNLILQLPDRSLPLQCAARVVYRRRVTEEDGPFPPGMGLQFINLGKAQAERLQNFVGQHLFPIDYSSA